MTATATPQALETAFVAWGTMVARYAPVRRQSPFANEDGGFMRKALLTAFVLAGGFVGCAAAPPPAPATHVVVGEASVISAPIFHPPVQDPGPTGDPVDTDI